MAQHPASTDSEELPEKVKNLLQVTQAVCSTAADEGSSLNLLGMCTSVIDKQVVETLGDKLNLICQKCGIKSSDTPLGYVLYGSVSGLQQAEQLITDTQKGSEFEISKTMREEHEEDGSFMVEGDAGQLNREDEKMDLSSHSNQSSEISFKNTSLKLDLSTAVQINPSRRYRSNLHQSKKIVVNNNQNNYIEKSEKPDMIGSNNEEIADSLELSINEITNITNMNKAEKGIRKDSEIKSIDMLDPAKIVDDLLRKHEIGQYSTNTNEQQEDFEELTENSATGNSTFLPEVKVKIQHNEPEDEPEYYVCVKCSYYGYTRLSLKRHLKRMHDAILCDFCMDNFEVVKDLDLHVEQMHQGEEKQKILKSLKKKPKNTPVRINPEAKIKKFKMVICCFCQIKLPTTKLMEVHMIKLHSEEYEKIKDDIQFDFVQTDLYSHSNDNNSTDDGRENVEDNQCPYCNVKILNCGALKRHMLACQTKSNTDRCTIKKRLTVDEMAELFEIQMDTLEDIITEYPDNLKHKFKCDSCGYISNKQGVSRHVLRTHSGPANVVCKYCHQKFRKEWELRTHQRSHFDKKGMIKLKTLKHKVTDASKGKESVSIDHQCDVCSLHLSTESLLEVHKIRHHYPEKGWQCLICLLVFCETSSLKHHVQSHFKQFHMSMDNKEEKPKVQFKKETFLCEQCGTGFKTERSLKNHSIKCPSFEESFQFSYSEMGYNEEELMNAADLYPRIAKYIHQCPHCTYTSTIKGIEKHVARSHRKMNFQCGHCPRQFAREWHVKEHIRVSHKNIEESSTIDIRERNLEGSNNENSSNTVKCSECDYVCAKRGIAVHQLYHKKEWNLRCIVCKKNMPSLELMSQHLAGHFNPSTGQLIIPKCGKGYGDDALANFNKSVNIIFASEEDDHDSPRLCEECGLSFNTVTKLKHHMRSHSIEKTTKYEVVFVDEDVYECDCGEGVCVKNCIQNPKTIRQQKYRCPHEECGSLLSKPELVMQHLRKIHSRSRVPLQCEFCDRQYTEAKNLKVHIRKDHYKQLNYKCDICGKLFYDNSKLKYHRDTHLPKAERSDSSACKICGKVLVRKYLKQHLNSHTGKKPYKCNICERGFPYMTGLNRHMLHMHSKEAPYVCDICGKAFKIAAKLKYHKTIHTGESNHKCEQCNKVFTQLSSLKKHQQYHCIELEDSKRSMRLSSLLDDRESKLRSVVATPEAKEENVQQVFMCSVCKMTFTDFVEIQAHVLTHEADPNSHQELHLIPADGQYVSEQPAQQELQIVIDDSQGGGQEVSQGTVLQQVQFVQEEAVEERPGEITTIITQSSEDGQETYLVTSC